MGNTFFNVTKEGKGQASSVLNDKLYVIGGINLSKVEIYDPSTESWSTGTAFASAKLVHGTAITVDGKIYLIGGRNASDQDIKSSSML